MRRIFLLLTMGLLAASSACAVTLAWDASDQATGYRLYYGRSTAAYDTILDTGPATSASISGLTPGGTYYFAATAYNSAGESTYSNEVSSVIPPTSTDTIPPTVAITSPSNGASVPRKGTVTITATASDNVGVTRVEFYVDSQLQRATGSPPYSCTWNVPAAGGNRRYQLQAKAYDAAGNVGVSTVVEVTAQ